jgi:septum site-determining protein MinC
VRIRLGSAPGRRRCSRAAVQPGIIEKLDAPAENLAIPMSGEQQPSSQVRSGQSVIFPSGDVTVIGSVASGAEVVAGDSIHIYGTLRGRAMAGSTGNARARIFCRKVEAELLAIGDRRSLQDRRDIDASLRSRPVQVWLEADDGIL